MHGFQAAGIYNHVSDSVKGSRQPVLEIFLRKVNGVQIEGSNISNREMNGANSRGYKLYKKLKGCR